MPFLQFETDRPPEARTPLPPLHEQTFGQMVGFMLKLFLAAIPALVVVGALVLIVVGLFFG